MMPNRNEFQRVSLTLEAAVRFPDIGTRHGTLSRRSGAWAVVRWDGAEGETWLPGADLENVT